MAAGAIKPYTDWILQKIAAFLAFLHLTPNVLTIMGVFLNAGVAIVIMEGRFFLATWLYLIVSMTDLLDGILARQKKLASTFGGFLDSVMDRFGDAVIFLGIIAHYAIVQNIPCILIASLAMCLAQITSYTRARAECVIPKCKIGFMERPERVILLSIGLVSNRLPICLLIMAAFSLIIIVNRIIHTRKELEKIHV